MPIPRLGRLVGLMLLVLLLTTAVTAVSAQTSDLSSADSLAAMLKMLTDPTGQGSSIVANPAAAEIDRQVQALTGSPQLSQEVYALAAQVLADLMKSTGGDIGKLSETLDRARSDPAAFAAGLSPQTLQQLIELSAKISAAKR